MISGIVYEVRYVNISFSFDTIYSALTVSFVLHPAVT